ncbi:unnamed protein product, partial [Didymodactylos carnosus]
KRPTFLPRFQNIWKVLRTSSDFNSPDWWADFKTSLTLLLQDEQRQMTIDSRRELRDLQTQYRIRATNPLLNDFVELDIIRNEILRLLEEKVSANIHFCQQRNAQSLGILARSRLSCLQSNQSKISFLVHPTKGRIESIDGMLDIATNFYRELYQGKTVNEAVWNSLLDGLPMMDQHDRMELDREITVAECFDALRAMPSGRAPGEDGILVEIWQAIFPIIGEHYVRMINVAKEKGCFQPGFLSALLTLLKKGNAIDGSMKGFRPLSLMNVDYKILSKVLSIRLSK